MKNFNTNLGENDPQKAVLNSVLLNTGLNSNEDDATQLQNQYAELSFLCMNYDPYNPEKSSEIQSLLEKYKLSHLEDPFTITNYLLKMLDECEAKIKNSSSEIH